MRFSRSRSWGSPRADFQGCCRPASFLEDAGGGVPAHDGVARPYLCVCPCGPCREGAMENNPVLDQPGAVPCESCNHGASRVCLECAPGGIRTHDRRIRNPCFHSVLCYLLPFGCRISLFYGSIFVVFCGPCPVRGKKRSTSNLTPSPTPKRAWVPFQRWRRTESESPARCLRFEGPRQ